MARGWQPPVVEAFPGSVGPNVFEGAVDESNQVVVVLLDTYAVGLDAHALADHVDVRILAGKAFQYDVVGADRIDLSLLHHQEAVGPAGDTDQGRPRIQVEHPFQRCRPRNRTHPFAGKVRSRTDSRVLPRKDLLIRIEVRGGEVDVLFAFTGDREGPDHQVDLAGLER